MTENKPPEMGAYSFLRIFAWATYDLANTLFAINIISLYFPLWVLKEGGSDLLYALAASLSLFLASCLMPFLGTLSDFLQRRMPFLIFTTLLCILATAFLSQAKTLTEALLLFGIAHFGYQLGLLFYDALLPKVAPQGAFGKVSGIGVALGYVGTLVGIVLVRPFVLSKGYQASFLPTAFFFLLFSLPCFLFVRETETRASLSPLSLGRETIGRFRKGFSHFQKGSPLRPVLWAYFFALMAIQPVILFMSVYLRQVMGLEDREMTTYFLLTTCAAILGAFLTGLWTDRFKPWRVLLGVLGGWCVGLLLASFAVSQWHFWGAGILIGGVLGGMWVASRVLLVQLSSPEYLGEILGCIGSVGRIAAILGPLGWGGTVWGFRSHFPWNYRMAVLELFFWMGLAFFFLASGYLKNFSKTFLKTAS